MRHGAVHVPCVVGVGSMVGVPPTQRLPPPLPAELTFPPSLALLPPPLCPRHACFTNRPSCRRGAPPRLPPPPPRPIPGPPPAPLPWAPPPSWRCRRPARPRQGGRRRSSRRSHPPSRGARAAWRGALGASEAAAFPALGCWVRARVGLVLWWGFGGSVWRCCSGAYGQQETSREGTPPQRSVLPAWRRTWSGAHGNTSAGGAYGCTRLLPSRVRCVGHHPSHHDHGTLHSLYTHTHRQRHLAPRHSVLDERRP